MMSLRTLLGTASLLLLTSTLACATNPEQGGTTSHGGAGTGAAGTGGSGPDVEIDQSSTPRQPAAQVSPAALAEAVGANNAFAVDLYGRLAAGSTSNVITSPLSASIALTMTYAGAKGPTATGMAKALHLGSATTSIFEGQNALTQALDGRAATALAAAKEQNMAAGAKPPSPSDYQLQVVNSVWGEEGNPWEKSFLEVLSRDYGTGVYQVDFSGAPETARQTINAWVSKETGDKINGLLPMGSIKPTTQMVLVNAIHLKLPWASPFSTGYTHPAPFTKADGTKVTASFMGQESGFSYTEDADAQIVALPLEGNNLDVVITLPKGDLATYEAGLTASSPALSVPGSYALVNLQLPKTSFTSQSFSLKKPLTDMGMGLAFTPSADFSGMMPEGPLQIDDVLQKAMIAMEENGVEAAAATAVIVGSTGAAAGPGPTPVTMTVDRPFLISIVDATTGAVLFLGHIEDPTDAG
jgi:serpin B